MCYSAKMTQDLKRYQREFGARANWKQFEWLFSARLAGDKVKIPKALEANFQQPETPEQERIKALIDEFNQREARRLEKDLFAQRKRLADAERALLKSTTKAALESRRIATNKVEWLLEKLEDLKRTEPKERDSRIFPFWYAPVLRQDGGELVVEPMRYHCRPSGKPAFYDRRYDGLYNARRNSLDGFWKAQFGATHAIAEVTGFFENVSKHRLEGRELRDDEKEENVVIRFEPRPSSPMLVAALWSKWTAADAPDLTSFAIITDEPPAEVAAAGHDRCPIQLTHEAALRWMAPAGRDSAELQLVLDERERPYYEHRLVA